MTTPSSATSSTVADRLWSPFARMEELSFKRAREGWVFQAPNPWLIGRRRHYLVNDAQKSEIAALLRRMWMMVLVTILALVVVGLPALGWLFGDKHPVVMLVLATVCGGIGGVAGSVYTAFKMRPIIGHLQLTNQRITQREAILGQARIFSRARIAFFGLLSLALLALQLIDPLFFNAGWSTISVVGVGLFGIMTIFWAALFIAKGRAERSAT